MLIRLVKFEFWGFREYIDDQDTQQLHRGHQKTCEIFAQLEHKLNTINTNSSHKFIVYAEFGSR